MLYIQCTVRIIPIKRPGYLVSHFRWGLIEMLKNSAKDCYMCAWGSSFQWAMGRSTRANRPNRRCRGGCLLVANVWNYWGKTHLWALIRAWALNSWIIRYFETRLAIDK